MNARPPLEAPEQPEARARLKAPSEAWRRDVQDRSLLTAQPGTRAEPRTRRPPLPLARCEHPTARDRASPLADRHEAASNYRVTSSASSDRSLNRGRRHPSTFPLVCDRYGRVIMWRDPIRREGRMKVSRQDVVLRLVSHHALDPNADLSGVTGGPSEEPAQVVPRSSGWTST
jgi:hypothetical protein